MGRHQREIVIAFVVATTSCSAPAESQAAPDKAKTPSAGSTQTIPAPAPHLTFPGWEDLITGHEPPPDATQSCAYAFPDKKTITQCDACRSAKLPIPCLTFAFREDKRIFHVSAQLKEKSASAVIAALRQRWGVPAARSKNEVFDAQCWRSGTELADFITNVYKGTQVVTISNLASMCATINLERGADAQQERDRLAKIAPEQAANTAAHRTIAKLLPRGWTDLDVTSIDWIRTPPWKCTDEEVVGSGPGRVCSTCRASNLAFPCAKVTVELTDRTVLWIDFGMSARWKPDDAMKQLKADFGDPRSSGQSSDPCWDVPTTPVTQASWDTQRQPPTLSVRRDLAGCDVPPL